MYLNILAFNNILKIIFLVLQFTNPVIVLLDQSFECVCSRMVWILDGWLVVVVVLGLLELGSCIGVLVLRCGEWIVDSGECVFVCRCVGGFMDFNHGQKKEIEIETHLDNWYHTVVSCFLNAFPLFS